MPLPYTVDDPFLQDNLDELDKRTSISNAQNSETILSWANGWGNYSDIVGPGGGYPSAYLWKQADGTVFMVGTLTKAPFGSSTFVANETICTISLRFRPERQHSFLVIASDTTGAGFQAGSVVVIPDGRVSLLVGAKSNPVGSVGLNTLVWKAATPT